MTPAASTAAPGPLILVVEDFMDLREVFTVALKHGGYRTLGLNSGDEVLTTPRETLMEASCALVDDSLCGNLTGVQTVVLLHLINPGIKVFPIPGRQFNDHEHALIAQHHRQILYKPFSVETLLTAINDATGSVAMNPLDAYRPPSKIIPAVIKTIKYGVVACLFGIALLIAWQDEHFRQLFSWPVVSHWLCAGSTILFLAIAVTYSLTLAVFAFNPDWHTFDGFLNLLLCLFFEAVGIAVLAGIYLLVVAAWHLQ